MESGINEAIYIREVMEEIFGLARKSIKVHIFTDNKSLLQAIMGNKGVSEKRLRRDIDIIKQSLKDEEINSIEWVSAENMLADSLTKKTADASNLLEVMQRKEEILEEN